MRILIIALLLFLPALTLNAKDRKDKYVDIKVGSSKESIKDKLGKPGNINYFGTPTGIGDVWLYNCEYLSPCGINYYYDVPCVFLIFDGEGKLSTINNLR